MNQTNLSLKFSVIEKKPSKKRIFEKNSLVSDKNTNQSFSSLKA
jgi:hypothetical protein